MIIKDRENQRIGFYYIHHLAEKKSQKKLTEVG